MADVEGPIRSDIAAEPDQERRNIARLVRWIAAFVWWPSFSVAVAFWIWDSAGHRLHMIVLFALSAAAVALFVSADKVAGSFFKS